MVKKNFLILMALHSLLTPSQTFAEREFSGFYNPSEITSFPLANPENSVFKLIIDRKNLDMHGTAFAISPTVLLTNVHNITQCLLDHNLVDEGYSGQYGPLKCGSLALLNSNGEKIEDVLLLASHSRSGVESQDFAVIQVPKLKATPLSLTTQLPTQQEVMVVGFPGETFRQAKKAKAKMESLMSALNVVFDEQKRIAELNLERSTTEGMKQDWLNKGFVKIQKFLSWSEYLSGALIGKDWNPLLSTSEKSDVYQQHLLKHLDGLMKDIYFFIKNIEMAMRNEIQNDSDANGNLKVSRGRIVAIGSNGTTSIRGDGRPGSSGSPVVNAQGAVLGIIFQIERIEHDSDDICILDAFMSDFESLMFNYCPSLGPTMVNSSSLINKLAEWKIAL